MRLGSVERAVVLLVLLAWLGQAGCPPPTVVITDESGQPREVSREEAARIEWQKLQPRLAQADLPEQASLVADFIKRYPDAAQVDEALRRLGDGYFGKQDWQQAVEYYRRLMVKYPDSPHYLHAAVQLGLCLARLGRTGEALPTLRSVFERLDTRRRAEVASMLAEAYLKIGKPVEALRWYVVLYRDTRIPGARPALQQQVTDLIDKELDFTQTRQALEMLRRQELKGFPRDILSFKLAKIFFHILDMKRAQSQLEDFLASYPGHRLSGEAAELLKRISERGKVNPQAIGVLLPLSGQYREYGRRALEGIQLGTGVFAAEPAPAATAPLLIIRDSGGDPDQAVRQLEDLVVNEHVVAVIGPMVAKEAYAAAMKAEELQVPLVTLSIRQDIPSLGKYVFRNFLTLTAQARTLVGYAMDKLGVKRFAILHPNDWYGVEFANAFWDEVERRHGEVRAAEHYEPDEKNFAPAIKKMVGRFYLEARWDYLKERNRIRRRIKSPLGRKRALEKLLKKLPPQIDFEAVFVPDYVDKAVLIAPALAFEDIILHTENQWRIDRIKKSLGRTKLDMVYLLGGNGWNDQHLVEWAGRYVQGAIFSAGFFAASERPATRLFVGRFTSTFDREPSMVEAESYDTAAILRQLVEKVHPGNREQFRRALLQVRDFDGVTGRTSFGPDGDAHKELFLLTVDKEEIKEVKGGPEAHEPRG